jgi:hypothetical protein
MGELRQARPDPGGMIRGQEAASARTMAQGNYLFSEEGVPEGPTSAQEAEAPIPFRKFEHVERRFSGR